VNAYHILATAVIVALLICTALIARAVQVTRREPW
jgi:hypothetical protein